MPTEERSLGFLYTALDSNAYVCSGYTCNIPAEEQKINGRIYAVVQVPGRPTTEIEMKQLMPGLNNKNITLPEANKILRTFSRITGCPYRELIH